MKRYASYKASGVAWLGDVPSHWIPKRLKHLGQFRAGAGFPIEEQGNPDNPLPFFKVKDIDGANQAGIIISTNSTISFETANRLGAKIFPKKSIVFAKVGAALLLNRFRLLGVEACIDNNMMGYMVDANEAFPEFMYWAMQRINFSEIVNPGTVPSLSEPLISNLFMAIPPPDEQQAIADYLDTETARIDDLIREKEELIGLLREWRQSVIAEAVTKGLDKTAAMKPSGVPWLGDIPSHWDAVGMTKKIASIVDYRGKTPEKVDQGVFLVTAKNIREGFIDYDVSQEFVSVDDYEEVMRRGKPDIGDVLFTTEAPLGNVALVNRTDIALAQRVIKFKGIPQTLDNSFLMYWLLSRYMQEQLSSWSSGSTAEGIKSGRLVRLPLALPPFNEQQAIADYLDDETAKIDALITHTQEEIALLKELRAATIADAVLGRVDVRECQK